MAVLSDITIKKELRLCKVGKETGYFHCWEQYSDVIAPGRTVGSHPGGQYSRVFGIVEFDDGVERVSAEKIRFVDETNDILHENNIHAIINAEKTTSIMEGGCKSMSNCDESCLLNGGDCVGMTDGQYKGILLDQLEDWQEVLDMAVEAGNAEIQKKAEKQIAKINEKLKF